MDATGRIRRRGTLLLVGVLLAPAAVAETPDGWQPVRDDDGIVVHRRAAGGSSFDELRAIGIVRAPLAAVLAVIEARDNGTEWMFNCVESKTLEAVGDDGAIVYNRTRTPWPLADRDTVVRGRRRFEPGHVRVDFESVDYPARPPVAGVVRMPMVRGHWLLTPEASGAATRVEYQMHADPGGALPAWAVNGFARDMPWETIDGLRAEVVKHRYPEEERALLQRPEYRALVGTP